MNMETWKEELYHHGILGMQWGKRNGPPYPLGASDHSAAEKKAGWRKSLSQSSSPSLSNKKNGSYDKKVKDDAKKGLSDKQKKAIKIGVAVVGTALIAYGAYRLGSSQYGQRIIVAGKDRFGSAIGLNTNMDSLSINANKDIIPGFNTIRESETASQALAKVNPHVLETDLGYHMNCGNCVIAMEARLRGNAAEAAYNKTGMTISSMASYFKGLKSESFCNPKIDIPNITDREIISSGKTISDFLVDRGTKVHAQVVKSIGDSYPNGSRGCLFIPAQYGSHWVSWVKDSTGKVVVMNPQDPNANLIKDWFGLYTYHKNNMGAEITAIRLDDVQFNLDNIKEVIIKSGSKTTTTTFDTYKIIGQNFVSKLQL